MAGDPAFALIFPYSLRLFFYFRVDAFPFRAPAAAIAVFAHDWARCTPRS
jgi:hypothetical protein